MKKLLALTLAVLLTGALLAGCGSSDSSSAAESSKSESKTESPSGDSKAPESSSAAESETESKEDSQSEEVRYPAADAPFDPASGMTENMLARSVHYEGDTSRLKAKLTQLYDADFEGQTNIVFLGDSITAGSGAKNARNAFWSRISEWLDDTVESLCICRNAGIGATDSYLGVHRVDKDVLSLEPDIIFIEFINDRDDSFYKASMESLIRKCLAAPKNPAVVLVEMTLKGGGNCQNAHTAAAEAYGVPVLSYHDAAAPEVEAGNFSFDAISDDGTHPNDIGHGWVADIIKHFLEKVRTEAGQGEVTAFDPSTPSVTGDKYANAGIYDKDSAGVTASPDENFTLETTPWNFKKGWATDNGGSITFEAEFRNFGLLYYKTTDGKTGIATIEIDGEKVGYVDGNFPNGWGDYPASEEVYTSDEAKKHTVTITVRDGDKKHFEILSLLMS